MREFMIAASRGRNPDNPSERKGGVAYKQVLEIKSEDITNALTSVYTDNLLIHNKKNMELNGKRFRIRKLTPRECWRLMGVDDKDFDKVQAAGISNSQLYKLAGNSIVVDVLAGIFAQMFREDNDTLF